MKPAEVRAAAALLERLDRLIAVWGGLQKEGVKVVVEVRGAIGWPTVDLSSGATLKSVVEAEIHDIERKLIVMGVDLAGESRDER